MSLWLKQWIRTGPSGRRGFVLLCFICCEPPSSYILLRSWIQTRDWWVMFTLLCCNPHSEHVIFLLLLLLRFIAVQRRGQIAALWTAARPQMDWKKWKINKYHNSSDRYTGIWPVTWHKKNRRTLKCQLSLRWLSIIKHHTDMFALTYTGSTRKLDLHLHRCTVCIAFYSL